jgi:RNA polymerase sigma-70 factor (ECF subfamily)
MPSTLSEAEQVSLSSKPASGESGDSLALLARAQKGDAESFGELCRLHEGRLLRQAMLLCPESAEDLVQECLLGAWKSIGKYRGGCQFFTWLCAIMLNQHRNLRRKRWPALLSNLFKSDDAFSEIAAETRAPDESAEASDEAVFVQRCVRRLSPKHREIIHLRFYVDDSLEGIATALGCSIGTVKSRLFHALENLKKMTEAGRRGTE